jgi:hypothetical protein
MASRCVLLLCRRLRGLRLCSRLPGHAPRSGPFAAGFPRRGSPQHLLPASRNTTLSLQLPSSTCTMVVRICFLKLTRNRLALHCSTKSLKSLRLQCIVSRRLPPAHQIQTNKYKRTGTQAHRHTDTNTQIGTHPHIPQRHTYADRQTDRHTHTTKAHKTQEDRQTNPHPAPTQETLDPGP